MTWLQRYRVRHYLRNSIWVYPMIALAAGFLFARVLLRLETALGWVGSEDSDSVRVVLGTLAGATFTFMRLNRFSHVGAAVKADDDDLAFTRRFQGRVGPQRHRVIP